MRLMNLLSGKDYVASCIFHCRLARHGARVRVIGIEIEKAIHG